MASTGVRYIVDDVEAAAHFYEGLLGFETEFDASPGFAVVVRGDLRLMLSGVSGRGGASQPATDGRKPEPGGWNRIQLEVADLEAEVAALRNAGAQFRSEIIDGRGGRQILVDDPSGNPVELFEPKRG
jgi:catechol 2,3-dioxygenase-like lactoylglutathione lyase family enzyme